MNKNAKRFYMAGTKIGDSTLLLIYDKNGDYNIFRPEPEVLDNPDNGTEGVYGYFYHDANNQFAPIYHILKNYDRKDHQFKFNSINETFNYLTKLNGYKQLPNDCICECQLACGKVYFKKHPFKMVEEV